MDPPVYKEMDWDPVWIPLYIKRWIGILCGSPVYKEMDWDRIYLVDRVVYPALAKTILYPITPGELHTEIKSEPRENKTVVKGD